MKVSDYMMMPAPRQKGKGRHRNSYRAARRNFAKINYRRTKRMKKRSAA